VAGEIIVTNEPVCWLRDGGDLRVQRQGEGLWRMTWSQQPEIQSLVRYCGQGRYGEEILQIQIRNNSGTPKEIELMPPFCQWTMDEEQTKSCCAEYLYIHDRRTGSGDSLKTNGVLGGFGSLRVLPLQGEFNMGQFVTIPAGDGIHSVTAYLRLVEGAFPLEPDTSCLYELHLDCLPGKRNDVLQEIFRVRGCYLVDPAQYDYSRYEDMPWVKDIVAAWINWSWDRDVMDPRTGEYRISSLLEDARKTMGGFDLYEFWPFWPRAGFDDRNQFDHFRDMPGGLDGLRAEIDHIHDLDIRVILGYCYWSEYDQVGSTGWEQAKHQSYGELLDLALTLDADGVVMDCMSTTPEEIIEGSRSRGKALLPYNEGDPSWWDSQTNLLGRIHDSEPMCQFNLKKYMAPHHPILRVTGPGAWGKRMRNDFVLSFFNGHGVEILTMFPERHPDCRQDWPILVRALDILRSNRQSFASKTWDPLVASLNPEVWINKWPAGEKTIFTLCGTAPTGHSGDLLKLEHQPEVHYVDLWRYRALAPRHSDGYDILEYEIDPYSPGHGAPHGTGDYSPGCIGVFPALLSLSRNFEMLEISVQDPQPQDIIEIWVDTVGPEEEPVVYPAKSRIEVNLYEQFGYTNDAIIVRLVDRQRQLRDVQVLEADAFRFFRLEKPHLVKGSGSTLEGMIRIPGGTYMYSIKPSQPYWQYTYYNVAPSNKGLYTTHPGLPATEVELPDFWIDRYPVTNAQFAAFVEATGYLQGDSVSPVQKQNFLKHFRSGLPPVGQEDHPVVYVSYEDALAYCRWAGKRLPTEVEWHYAAGGMDSRAYPWGNEIEEGKYNNTGTGTTPVHAYPGGASPFGVEDMVGNIYHWTASLMTNGQHDLIFLRGGCWHRSPEGIWWIKGGLRRINDHHPFPLFGPGMNRCSTVGFRCVVDA
jgi:iron(II)-dependent oxidoreductase